MKLKSIKRLKVLADQAVSKFVRARNPVCQICDKNKSEMAYHVISRRHMNTRWLEANVLASCGSCNYGNFRFPDKYTAIFIRKFGAEKYLSLEEESRKIFQPRRPDLKDIISVYKSRLEYLKTGGMAANKELDNNLESVV